ncbi:MAG: flagellar protein FlaG [Candidatus Thiodiazotropha sp.]|jgi:flagellar protein FlaG
MPSVIANLADQYAYKREVPSTGNKVEVASPQPLKSEKVETVPVQSPLDRTELASKVENLNQLVHRNLEFSVDEETGHSVVRVVDSDTGKVVRQIPPDQILHVISQVQNAKDGQLSGVFLDDQA